MSKEIYLTPDKHQLRNEVLAYIQKHPTGVLFSQLDGDFSEHETIPLRVLLEQHLNTEIVVEYNGADWLIKPRVFSQEKGLKFDDDKLRFDLIPPEVIEELAKVLTHGALKYSENNWKLVEPFNDRYYAALMRHLEAWRKGEKLDKDSGLHHLSHVITNVAFLLWKDLQKLDDEELSL